MLVDIAMFVPFRPLLILFICFYCAFILLWSNYIHVRVCMYGWMCCHMEPSMLYASFCDEKWHVPTTNFVPFVMVYITDYCNVFICTALFYTD